MSPAVHVSCDAAAAQAHACRGVPPRPTLVLATTILASSLAFIDGSVVNVGLPAIGRSLGAQAGGLQWIVNAYLLPLSALLLLGGAAGDRFGRRHLLIAGIIVFALASAACAFAPTLEIILAGRLMQGAGAAMLMPNSLAILGATFDGESKGRAIGLWAASGAIAGAMGPVLGGWLVDLGSWRAIFLLNLPLAVAAVVLAKLSVPDDKDSSRDLGRDSSREPLDLFGGLLATATLGLSTWALTVASGRAGWTVGAVVATLLAVALLGLFLATERARGARAMIPLALFGSRRFVGLTLLTVLLYGALGGLMVLIPYVLIEAAGYTSAGAGAALLPLPLVLSVVSPLTGALAGRVGARLPLTVGPLVMAVGFLLATRIGATGSYWTDVLPAIIVIALGLSGAVAPLTTAVLNSVYARHTGSASGLNSAVARTGGLIATALVGAVLVSSGERLVSSFHGAAVAGAVACIAASASAFLLIGRGTPASR